MNVIKVLIKVHVNVIMKQFWPALMASPDAAEDRSCQKQSTRKSSGLEQT